jgi:hypothetical protein
VLRAICERLPAGADLSEIESLAEQLLAADDLIIPVTHADELAVLPAGDTIRLADGRAIPARADLQRYSTKELLALEAEVIAAAAGRQGDGAGLVPKQVVTVVLAGHLGRRPRPGSPLPRLAPDQAAMVAALTTSGHGVQLVNAQAGAGKTFALDAARAVWQAAGYRVVGAALPGRAAEELAAGAGIDSSTISRLLLDLEDPRAPGLGPGTVLVIDEAGMVGTRLLARLLAAAEHAGAKVVLVGDTQQLPEIDCGGLFRGLQVRLGAVELANNRRQVERWEREALALLRAGDAGGAVGRYWQHGRVVVGDSAPALRSQLVADWWAAMGRSGEQPPVMIAARRADVVDLNGRARALMVADGRLGPQALTVGGQEYAVGDRIVTLRNQRRRLGVANGTRGTVTAVDVTAGALEVRTDHGRAVRLPRWYLTGPRRRVDYGYAVTGHKAEGMTTDRTFVLGSEDIYKEWGYTALSRGRLENRLYLVIGDNPLAQDLDMLGQPTQDPVGVIVRALGRSHAKTLALDHLVAARAKAAELPEQELQARVARAAALLEQRPRLNAHTGPGELRQEQARLRGYQREELSWLGEAHDQLAQGGLPRGQRRRLQAAIGEREQALTQLGRRLADVDQRLADLDAQWVAQAAWDRDHAQPLGEALIFGRELSHRELAEAVRLEQDPPGHLVAELGGRPDTPAGRAAWRAAAIAIQAYRASHQVDDPTSALGPAPTDPAAQLEWVETARLARAAVQAIDTLDSPVLPEPTPNQLRDLAL